MMKRWLFASVALASLGFACVDLFHKTDFETGCAEDGSAAGCTGSTDARVDAPATRTHLDTCGYDQTKLETLTTRTCAWLGSCEGPYRESRFGQCMIHARAAYDCKANPNLLPVVGSEMDLAWSCLAGPEGNGPNNCDDVYKCLYPPEGRAKSVPFDAGSTLTLCDNSGSVAVFSAPGDNYPIATDPCVLHARHCVRINNNSAAVCVPQPDTAKPVSTVDSICLKTYASIQGSQDETDRGLDCAYIGAGQCAKGANGPLCVGTGVDTCNDDGDAGAITCNGSRARACAGGKSVEFDCDRLGMTCAEGVGTLPSLESSCVGKDGGGNCDGLTEDTDTCADKSIVSCVRGQTFKVDCRVIGLGSCVQDPKGSRCVP